MRGSGSRAAPRGPSGVPRARKTRLRWQVAALCAVLAALWFGFLELRGLYFPDEGRYAEIPREMLASGDWVTPRLNGFPYFEKPPLQYWVTAATFAVVGEHEWTTRLAPALAGLAGVLAVLLTARRILSRRAAWMAAAVLASSWGYFMSSQFVTLDMTLTACLMLALCAFLLAQDARASSADNRRWMLVAWALCALAVLTKGVIGVVLPALAVATYVVVRRDVALMRRLHVGAGIAVVLLIAAPWFLLVEARNPGFAEFFFVREHLQRFTEPLHRRPGAWWYFIPIAVAFLMPWLPAIVAAHARRSRAGGARPAPAFDPRIFCWCWAGAILAFFSASSSKLPAYILPAMGAVALAAGAPLAARWRESIRITGWTLIAAGAASVVLVVPATEAIEVPLVRQAFVAHQAWVFVGALVLAAGGVAALLLLRANLRMRALAALVIASIAAAQVGTVLAYQVDGYFSAHRLIDRMTGGTAERPFRPEIPFYSVDTFDPSVAFYLGRTVTLVREQGELAWGIAADPRNFIADFAEFEARWRASDAAYAIMSGETYRWLVGIGFPMTILDSDGRRVVVTRR
jgi:4-amino-4-deoxy-L-arabinose transferase-like glycosyltransferase